MNMRTHAKVVCCALLALATVAMLTPDATARPRGHSHAQQCNDRSCRHDDCGRHDRHHRNHRHARHHCGARWVPGHYTWERKRICVQRAHYEMRWVEPIIEYRRDRCGRVYTVVIRDGYYDRCYVPARYEWRRVKHWVPGHWTGCRRGCHSSHRSHRVHRGSRGCGSRY